MISFIVIGRNEGWKLSKCFSSIENFIKDNNLQDFEIIYVDSKSTDDSLARAKEFAGIKIFLITGECNAAIARNIGGSEATGDVLFFIDGDMEIQSSFYSCIFNSDNTLKYSVTTGQLYEKQYDGSWKIQWEGKRRKYKDEDVFEGKSGGIFVIASQLWKKVGGMRTKYRRTQDWDMGTRLAKIGYLILLKKEVIAIHHTIDYRHKDRWKKRIFSTDILYYSVYLRDHFFSRHVMKRLIREAYPLILIVTAIALSIIFKTPLFLLLYLPIAVGVSNLLRLDFKAMGKTFVFNTVRDMGRLFGLFFFWPSEKKIIYRRIA